jgi:beta-1,4-mannosyltransferase
MLLEALRKYEMKAQEVNGALGASGENGEDGGGKLGLPKVWVIVTGKGPLKEKYMNEVVRLETTEKWKWVRCRSLWLEAGAYPVMLGMCNSDRWFSTFVDISAFRLGRPGYLHAF